jgi:hypothetical protein
MSRQRKLGRPVKRRGRQLGPIKWTPERLAKLADDLHTALQARDGSWAKEGTVIAKFADETGKGADVLIKRISEAQWVRKKPPRITARWLASWIKANEQLLGEEYPSAEQLRQILKSPVDLVAFNNAYWKRLLEDGEK